MHYLYKNQLQTYAQKQNLRLPTYSCEREGPPHASRFRCKVTVGEQTFECQEFFPSIKEAEHNAARIALTSLLPDATQEVDCIVYKNLLQELTQKNGYLLPVYSTKRSGEAHIPIFISNVEVVGKVFIGNEAKTKKQAEMNAAKVAYMSLQEGNLVQTPTSPPMSSQRQEAVNSSSSALSNVNDKQQHDSRSELCVILSPNSTPAEKRVDEIEAPCFLDNSHEADVGKKRCSSSSSSASPTNESVNGVKDSIVNPPSKTPRRSSSMDQYHVKTNTSPSIPSAAGTNLSPSFQRIVVRPHVPNMTFPPGSEIVMSDDNWIAVRLASQPNQQ